MKDKLVHFIRVTPRRRLIAFALMALAAVLYIYDWLDTTWFFQSWFPRTPLCVGLLLMVPDLLKLKPSRKLLGWCLLIVTAIILYFGPIDILLLAVVPFPLLCALICFFPKVKWLHWVMWGLFVLANIAAIYPLRGNLLILWFCILGITSFSAFHPLNVIASFMLNLMLPFAILGSVLTCRKPKNKETSQAAP